MRNFTILKAALTSAIFFFLFSVNSFAQCTLMEDFEASAWGAAGYALRTVEDSWGTWSVAGVGNMDGNDRFRGERSIRLRGNSGDNCFIQMDFDKTNGIGEVSFYYASYSGHSGGIIVLYYSTNGGTTWTDGGTVTAPAWDGEMLQAHFILNIQGSVRVKIVREGELTGSKTVNIDDLCLTDFNEAGYAHAPVFNPPGGSYTEPVNVTMTSTTPGAIIRYTTNGNDPDESSTLYSAPVAISTQTTLKAKAFAEEMLPSVVTTANYIFPQGVSTLAELRALAPEYNGGENAGTAFFTYTGQAVVTQVQTYRNVKYIQDATDAMYIYDVAGNIQTGVEIGDKITNITGKLTNYFGMVELIPSAECNVVGWMQQVKTTEITVNDLDYNHANPIQAKVVTLKGVMYAQTGTFATGTYYDIKENNVTYDSLIYTDNYDADYIGDAIPAILVDINGVCNFKGGAGIQTKNRIVPLNKDNHVIGTGNAIPGFNKAAIQLSPNPANSFVNIVTGSQMKLEVYGLLGNLIAVENLYEGTNTISVSEYPAGMYLMKLIDVKTGQAYVQKLVVQ